MVIDKPQQKCDGPLIILTVKETRDHYGDEEITHLGLSVSDCLDRLQ
jgi:hypothetical protein